MELFVYYLLFLKEISEGTRQLPAAIELTGTSDVQKALELQVKIEDMGIAEFVRLCAEDCGMHIPQRAYEEFDEQAVRAQVEEIIKKANAEAAANVSAADAPSSDAPAADALSSDTPAADAPAPEQEEPVRSEVRDIYEVFLDSVCLDDDVFAYLIDILKRRAKDEFVTLSRAAARTILDMDDFMAWLGNKELLAPVEERACVRIMDACFDRLAREEKPELMAALLSGDAATFRAFRAEAPELQHLPDATFEWYEKNYLTRYYPVRMFLKFGGVEFPIAE